MLNKVTLIGSLGKDPEVRTLQNGKQMATFSLATSESFKDKNGERKQVTEWHNIVIFNEGLARIASQYLKKGSKIHLEGQLKTRKWQDQNGQDRYSTEVVLSSFGGSLLMLDGRENGGGQQQKAVHTAPDTSAMIDDDIPF